MEALTWQDTDWAQIVGMYDVLVTLWQSPVAQLNRAVAIGRRDGPSARLEALAQRRLYGRNLYGAHRLQMPSGVTGDRIVFPVGSGCLPLVVCWCRTMTTAKESSI